MSSFGSVAWSSVGKKVITGMTGLALIGFVIVHLLGNLTLFIGPDAFNGYAHFLETAAARLAHLRLRDRACWSSSCST